MERFATRSSATPCALTATLIAPKPAPKPNSAAERPTRPGRERRGEQRAAAEEEAGERDAAAADPLAQATGHRHRDERAERGGEQRQPEPRSRQAGVVLHGGDPSGPGADHQPVAEEEEPDREAGRSHRPSGLDHPDAERAVGLEIDVGGALGDEMGELVAPSRRRRCRPSRASRPTRRRRPRRRSRSWRA